MKLVTMMMLRRKNMLKPMSKPVETAKAASHFLCKADKLAEWVFIWLPYLRELLNSKEHS